MALRAWGLGLALAAAVAVRLYAIHNLHFDGLYGQDSYAYYYHAQALWQDHALSYHWPWLPAPTRLFWPLGYPTLLAAVFGLYGQAATVPAQTVTVAAGIGVVALTYALALRMADAILPPLPALISALVAALLMALAGLQVQASSTIMSDAPALLWGTASVWLWTARAGSHTHTARPAGQASRLAANALLAFAAGASLALAISTRFEYVTLVPALLAYWWPGGAHPLRGAEVRGARMGWLLCGLAGAAVAGLPQALYSISYSAPVVDHQWLTTWSLAHLWQSSFRTVDGVQQYSVSVGAFYLLRPLFAPESLPWTLAIFLPLGVWGLARRTQSTPFLGLLLGWWLVPAGYLSGVPFESARFALIFSPSLAILEAIGFVAGLRWLCMAAPGRQLIVVHVAALWAISGLVVVARDAQAPLATLAEGKVADLQAVDWLQRHEPTRASIATFGLTLTLYHYGDLQDRWRLFDLSAMTAEDLRTAARTSHLAIVANTANLTRQWQGLPPEITLRRLVALPGVHLVARVGPYSVFQR